MSERTKKIIAEIAGQEEVRHYRTVILEVPVDMPDEEVKSVDADHFNHVDERTDWEVEESSGICAEGFPDLLGVTDDDAEPDVIVYRDETGDYRVRPNEKFKL